MTKRPWLQRALELSEQYLDSLPDRRVGPSAALPELRGALGGPLPEEGAEPTRVVEILASGVEGGLMATAGPRFFGFVIGGSLPAALAADWLASAWDQNAALHIASPAAATVEDVAAAWLLDLLGLPESASVGFVTGGQMANFTCLAAARHAVLARAGWNVEENGLQGAPPVDVVIGAEAHATILSALRMLGLGAGRARRVPVDDQGRVRGDELREALSRVTGPTIVCAQAGNVNTGAFDPIDEMADAAHERGAWLHVDGAFGLWAAASPARRHLVRGHAKADSWATDAHKWLNAPYDSGLAIVARSEDHGAAMAKRAAYLIRGDGLRDNHDFTPESSRRARGFAVWGALRSLGRVGVVDLVERCCGIASRMADRLSREPGVRLLNEVALNQVLVRFEPAGVTDHDAFTKAVMSRVQRDGVCWLSGSRWHGMDVMRVSVSNWSTTDADADRSVDAILDAARKEAGGRLS
jgi:glutamate/tyrosine decarboxylase-like PLP-dependent enzyme